MRLNLIRKLRQRFCKHKLQDLCYYTDYRGKWYAKGSNKSFKYRYDVFQICECYRCKKIIEKTKLRSNLNEIQLHQFLNQWLI